MAASPEGSMTLPAIMHYLQTAASRYERERNYWELERAEMKARIAKLEGERKSNERIRDSYLRRLRMMEAALLEERLKNDPNAVKPFGSMDQERGEKKSKLDRKIRFEGDEKYEEILRNARQSLKDRKGRAKSRTYLEKCLTEVTYLVSSNPVITSTKLADIPLNPAGAEQGASPESLDFSNKESGQPSVDTSSQRPLSPVQDSQIDTLEMNGTVERRTGDHLDRALAGEPRDDQISLEEQEEVERIQHTYDSQGQFLGEVSAMSKRDMTKTQDKATAASDDAWDFEESPNDLPAAQSRFEVRSVLRAHLDSVKCVQATVVEGTVWIASAGLDSIIRLHRYPDPEPVITLRGHTGVVTSLVFDSSSSTTLALYSAGEDMVIRKWSLDLSTPKRYDTPIDPSLTFVSHSQAIWALAMVHNHLLSASADGSVRQWNVESGESLSTWWLPETYSEVAPTSICGHQDAGKFAVGHTDGQIRLYSMDDQNSNLTITDKTELSEPSQINALIYSSHGDQQRLISGHEDKSIRIHDLRSRTTIHTYPAHTGPVCALVLTRSEIVSASHDNSIRLWSLDGDCTQELTVHREKAGEGVSSLDCVVSGAVEYLISAGADGALKVSLREDVNSLTS